MYVTVIYSEWGGRYGTVVHIVNAMPSVLHPMISYHGPCSAIVPQTLGQSGTVPFAYRHEILLIKSSLVGFDQKRNIPKQDVVCVSHKHCF